MATPEQCHFLQTVGDRVRSVREERELSMEQLALSADIAKSTLDHVEHGVTISLFVITKLADALDVTIDELVPLEALK